MASNATKLIGLYAQGLIKARVGCITPNCEGEHKAKGLCKKCYSKKWRVENDKFKQPVKGKN